MPPPIETTTVVSLVVVGCLLALAAGMFGLWSWKNRGTYYGESSSYNYGDIYGSNSASSSQHKGNASTVLLWLILLATVGALIYALTEIVRVQKRVKQSRQLDAEATSALEQISWWLVVNQQRSRQQAAAWNDSVKQVKAQQTGVAAQVTVLQKSIADLRVQLLSGQSSDDKNIKALQTSILDVKKLIGDGQANTLKSITELQKAQARLESRQAAPASTAAAKPAATPQQQPAANGVGGRQFTVEFKSCNPSNGYTVLWKRRQEDQLFRAITENMPLGAARVLMDGQTWIISPAGPQDGTTRTYYIVSSVDGTGANVLDGTAKTVMVFKDESATRLASGIDTVNGWISSSPSHNVPLLNQSAESCRRAALSRADVYSAWSIRTDKHPNADLRNTCFLYTTAGIKPFAGVSSDTAHMTGCLRKGEKVEWGCRTSKPDLVDANGVGGQQFTVEFKSCNPSNGYTVLWKRRQEDQLFRAITENMPLGAARVLMDGQTWIISPAGPQDGTTRTYYIVSSVDGTGANVPDGTAKTVMVFKDESATRLASGIDTVNGWISSSPSHNVPLLNQSAESCRRAALSRADVYSAWSIRTDKHPNADLRNTCFLYTTAGIKPFAGVSSDTAHMTGCLRKGEKVEWGCRTSKP